ncbi:hypothetical protein [Amycolatopsis pigmentata]|uniref:Uncharacterized protein n=1 Tax=Amycolatopsis pigmentata TaxID=450801 RepID=A0ABW5FT98_9PSEU
MCLTGAFLLYPAGTAVALFLTRWYSEVLAETVTFGKGPGSRERRAIISDASLLLVVAVVPVVCLRWRSCAR